MGITPQQLQAVLAHELAHIKRHDYLVNVFQVVAETVFFYHPAVWWTSKQIRIERELCCDDIAVRSCGDPIGYARALTALARQQLASPALTIDRKSTRLNSSHSQISYAVFCLKKKKKKPNKVKRSI